MHRIEGENTAWDGSKSQFRTGPPYTVMTPEFANAVQEELMNVIESSGLPILSEGNDTRNQLYLAIRSMAQTYDYFVDSPTAFLNLFERTAANTYKIKGEYTSVFFKKVTGGYSVASLLSGGDTWGDLYTNGCEYLEFQNGAFLNFAGMRGNLTVDTDGCSLNNVWVKGNDLASGVVESFLLAAPHVTFNNCKCSNRKSDGTGAYFAGFKGSAGDPSHNYTSRYVNCSVYSLYGTANPVTMAGFYACFNLSACITFDLDGDAVGNMLCGFYTCGNVSNCSIYGLGANNDIYGFHTCHNLSSCSIVGITSTSGIYGFVGCSSISTCSASDLTSSSAVGAHGFKDCYGISACSATLIETAGPVADATGFNGCYAIAACEAQTITSSGTAYGFKGCVYGAALYTAEAVNTGDWIDTVDVQVTNKVSTPSLWT